MSMEKKLRWSMQHRMESQRLGEELQQRRVVEEGRKGREGRKNTSAGGTWGL